MSDTTSEPNIDISKVIMSSIINIKPQLDGTTEVHLSLSKILNEIIKVRGDFSVSKIVVDETKIYVYINIPRNLFGELQSLIQDTQTRMTMLKKSIFEMIGNVGSIGRVKDIIQQNDDGIIVITINSTLTPTAPGVRNEPTW